MKCKEKESRTNHLTKPSLTYEGQENKNIYLAQKLAEKQLAEGTASSQVIVQYLKLGSEKDRLEREKLKEENKLLKAKTEAVKASADNASELAEAIRMFRTYSGESDEDV